MTRGSLPSARSLPFATMPHPLEAVLGHAFRDPALLPAALTHPSVATCAAASYERMEFLGDAVLGMVVCEALYARFPDQAEGDLTQTKSEVVSRKVCAEVAQMLGLPGHMTLGKSVDAGAVPASIAAAGMEAVIGALYLDGGLEAARRFILAHFTAAIERAAGTTHRNNWKAVLQHRAQKENAGVPQYRIVAERGPEHAKTFEVCASLGGRAFASAMAKTKKDAEQAAAKVALEELGWGE